MVAGDRRSPIRHFESFRTLLVWFLASVLPAAVAAVPEERPEVLVELERSRIYEGESVLYQVTLNHFEKQVEPTLAGFDDFGITLLGPPSSMNSQSITIVNGRMVRDVRRGWQYRYRLTPLKTGELIVPGPKVALDGEVIEGKELRLRVVPAAEQDLARIEISCDRASVYPLQPFTVTLTVALRPLPGGYADRDPLLEIRRAEPVALAIPWVSELPEGIEPASDWQRWISTLRDRRGGFSINSLSIDTFFVLDARLATFYPSPSRESRRTLDGRQEDYWVYRIERTFTARKVGVFGFGPATLKGELVTAVHTSAGGRPRAVTEDVYAVAKPVVVTVKDVPVEGRPEHFVGAVGRFEVAAELSPRKARIGDPLTLTLTLRGTGMLETALAPDLSGIPEVAEAFRVYEATEETKGKSLTFTYSLRPLTTEVTAFPEIPIAYFDVERERYVTVRTEAIPIEVEEAEALSGDDIVATPLARVGRARSIEAAGEGIFANITDRGELASEGVDPHQWLGAIGGMIVAYVAAAWFVGRARRLRGDKARERRRGAASRARLRLREAREVLATDARRGAELVRAMLAGLIADAADVPEEGLTPKDVRERMAELRVAEPVRARVLALLEICDGARYGASDGDLAELGGRAGPVLEELIESLKSQKRLR